MKKIVITEFMDAESVDALAAHADVHYDPALVDDPVRLAQLGADAHAVIVRNRTQVRGELLDAWREVRVVGRLGVGLDNIDMAACEERGIRVIPATGANALAVAEYVIGTAMLLLRGVYQSSDRVSSGEWPRTTLSGGREISGKVLGLVGFGGIGRLTAQLARGLGMHIVACDPVLAPHDPAWTQCGAQRLTLDQLVSRADVVSLHVPLTPDTRNLFGANRIARIKKGAILINTSRGGIADEAAVADAIRSGHLGGAAFDVFQCEPLPSGSPWSGCPNVILTPHVAGVTAEANVRVSSFIAAEVAKTLGLAMDARA